LIALVVAGGIGLLAVPGVVRRWGRRLPPEDWSRLTAASLLGGGVLCGIGLGIMALPTTLGLMHGSALAQACSRALGPLAPRGGPIAGWLATLLVMWSLVGCVRGRRGVSRAQQVGRIEPWLGEHRRFDGWELVVLPCDELFALSIPGKPSQVVVSRGMVTTLAPTEFDAVVAHERSHLAHRHNRYLLLLAVVGRALAFVPGLRRSVSALRVALERWADEDAAGRNDRRCVAAALAHASYLPVPEGLAAFGAASMILERLQALEAPPIPRTLRRAVPVYVVVVGLAMASVGALASQAEQFRVLGSLVSRCL